jgi:hypothetical protein
MTDSFQYACFRQGDVVLRRVKNLPWGVRPQPQGPLAIGEATGHSHRFEAGDTVQLWERGGRRFVEVFAPSRLLHEEHREILIPPGIYEQLAEREYDYADESMKAPVD